MIAEVGEEAKLNTPDNLAALYRQHRGRLWRAVYAYGRDREIASDAVAEAFAQALQRGDAIRDPLRWVWRAAFRIAAGELHARGKLRTLSEHAPESEPAENRLWDALGTLPEPQRAALILHYYGGYSVKETSSLLGSTPPAVQMRLVRGRRRLREALEGQDG